MTQNQHVLNKKIVGKNFSKAARNYDAAAQIQKIAAEKLCDLMVEKNLIKAAKNGKIRILDLGSGTSFIGKNLLPKIAPKILQNVEFFELDLSHEMLQQWYDASPNYLETLYKIQGDFEHLPCKKNSFDLIISSFSLQWTSDLEAVLSNVYDLLKNGGIFACCLPSDESLFDLRAASVASNCHFEFVRLCEVDSLKSLTKKTGFTAILVHEEVRQQNFFDGISALKSIRKIGASSPKKTTERKKITKKQLQSFNDFCLKNRSSFVVSWNLIHTVLRK
jgi:malonyl-CoA O-methyltransferase